MALIHWWPLKGDLQDKINGSSLTNNGGAVAATVGKIGGSYEFSGSNNLTQNYQQTLGEGKKFSLAFWIKLKSSWSGWGQVITIGKAGTSWTDIRLGVDINSDKRAYFSISNGSSSIGSNGPNHALAVDVWYHVVATYDNDLMSLYVNGAPATGKATLTSTYAPKLSDATIIAIGGNSSEKGECNMCDVRIYDHALSQAEIKELARAKIMHLSFDNPYEEGTTNESVISQWGHYTSYWTPIETTSSGWKVKKTSMDTSETIAISNSTIYGKMAVGDVWTLSCYLYKNGKPFKSPSTIATNYLGTTPTLAYESRDDGYFSCTFRVDAKKNAYPIHAPLFGAKSTFTMDDIFEIRYLQVEKKDHPTPYEITKRLARTRPTKIYNLAGINQPVTQEGVNYSKDCATGVGSLVANTSTWIRCNADTTNQTDITMSAWIKRSSGNGDCVIIGGVYLCVTSVGKLRTYCYGRTVGETGSENYITGNTVIPTDTWTHVAAVWDSYGVTAYINGVQEFRQALKPPTSYSNHAKKDVCSENRLNNRSFLGYIDDVRVYNSALSTEDIQDLMKTAAYAYKDGVLATDFFVEGSTDTITKKHTVQGTTLQETNIEGLEFLEYIQNSTGGSQYIDTGYAWTSEKATIVADLTYNTARASSTLFGNEEGYTTPYSSSKRYFAHILHAGSANGNFSHYIGAGSTGSIMSLTTGTRYNIEYIAHGDNTFTSAITPYGGTRTIINNKVAYSGTIQTKKHSTSQSVSNCGNIFIFSNHNAYNGTGAIQQVSAMTLYRFTMYDDGKMVRDFVPARFKGAIGLFDLVNGNFYKSPNGSSFIAGPAIANSNEIEFLSDGSIRAGQLVEL